MKLFSVAFAALSAASLAAGHMEMKSPPPLRSRYNKHTTNQDYNIKSPLDASGSNFPCRGALGDLGKPEGQAVEDWTAGEQHSITITGGAYHKGGSCQASLSYDKGKTFTAIFSWVGSCPTGPGDTKYDFTLPPDVQAGEALFAWTWFNHEGNREMYMNCAVINIKARQGRKKRGAAQSMSSRPAMFVANVGNGCSTVEGKDLLFPNPGPDVQMTEAKKDGLIGPVGNCQKPASGGDTPSIPPPDTTTPKPAPSSSKIVPPQSTSTGGKFPGENNPIMPPSSTNDVAKPTVKPTAPALPPSVPSPVEPETPSAPTEVTPNPGNDIGACTPGIFGCSPDGQAWQVCAVTKNWVRAGECPQGTVCLVNQMNKTPYCTQKA